MKQTRALRVPRAPTPAPEVPPEDPDDVWHYATRDECSTSEHGARRIEIYSGRPDQVERSDGFIVYVANPPDSVLLCSMHVTVAVPLGLRLKAGACVRIRPLEVIIHPNDMRGVIQCSVYD